jgi:hypothetical protein
VSRVINNEPVVEVINSLGFFYHKSPEVKYFEDGLYAGFRTMMNTGDILDRFGRDMKEEDIKKLEEPYKEFTVCGTILSDLK